MEFVRTIREKQQTARQLNIQKEAEEFITLSDFDSTLYIAYQGIPLIPIEDGTTTKDITQKLTAVRDTYIRYKKGS